MQEELDKVLQEESVFSDSVWIHALTIFDRGAAEEEGLEDVEEEESEASDSDI